MRDECTCVGCGRRFRPVGQARGRFCSPSCYHDYRRRGQRTRQCGYCGRFFIARLCDLRAGKCRYCSKSCAGRARVPDMWAHFWARVDQRGGPDACWPWMGSRSLAGYGQVGWRGRPAPQLAHRLAFTFVAGGPIPPGLDVCHRCDNPPCCNPAHLFAGTRAENVADMWGKGRAAPQRPGWRHPGSNYRGERHPGALVTAAAVRDIRRRAAGGERQVDLAREYELSKQALNSIVRRRTWRHVE